MIVFYFEEVYFEEVYFENEIFEIMESVDLEIGSD